MFVFYSFFYILFTVGEARKEFKTYVNILATIKTENNQKYLTLRKKYLNECPSDAVVQCAILAAASESTPSSPGATFFTSDNETSPPFRQPPPYKPPPEVNSPINMPIAISGGNVETEIIENFQDCVDEFTSAMYQLDTKRRERHQPESLNKNRSENNNYAENNRSVVSDDAINKENIPIFSFSSVPIEISTETTNSKSSSTEVNTENAISVKEATRKFNRMASEEEAKIISPSSQKKKAEKVSAIFNGFAIAKRYSIKTCIFLIIIRNFFSKIYVNCIPINQENSVYNLVSF